MKNEILFFTHIFLVMGLVILAARLGKKTLIALIVLQAVFANLFVVKQMSLFGFSVTCSDVFAIGGILGLNLLQERYGREKANATVKASFFGLIFFLIMSQFHLGYQPLATDKTQNAFEIIFSNTTRITIASVGVFWFVQKLDVQLFGFLQKVFASRFLPLRIGISLVVTQLLDTVFFSVFGLYGIVDSLLDVIVFSFLVKCLIISGCCFFTLFAKQGRDVQV